MGRVIRVVPNLNDEVADLKASRKRDLIALKVSKYENVAYLEAEHRMLKKHRDLCQCSLLVSPLCENIECSENFKLCGYIMQPVCERCVNRYDINKNTLKKILNALYKLHTHKPKIIHGDPRLQNLIINGSDYFWIDVLPSVVVKQYNIYRDTQTLVKSILSGRLIDIDTFKDAMRIYSTDVSENNLNKLCELLSSHF